MEVRCYKCGLSLLIIPFLISAALLCCMDVHTAFMRICNTVVVLWKVVTVKISDFVYALGLCSMLGTCPARSKGVHFCMDEQFWVSQQPMATIGPHAEGMTCLGFCLKYPLIMHK